MQVLLPGPGTIIVELSTSLAIASSCANLPAVYRYASALLQLSLDLLKVLLRQASADNIALTAPVGQ